MKKVAIMTSGGDAPGMNACVRAAVRGAVYHGIEIYGIYRGYDGMIEGDIVKMKSHSVSNIIQKGGTILKSARSEEFKTKEGRKKAFDHLQKLGIEGLITIGGDGTFTGAKIFYDEYGIPTVGAPGTIDNDLYGTDYTIGFDTAVNTALGAIDKIRDTADSHNRLFFIEVMGRDSGYIAIRSGIGGGAELVMVPETSTSIKEVISTLREGWARHKTSSIVVVAEGDEEGNAMEIAAKVKKAINQKDIKVSILGHIQRGGSPSAQDRILASRLGLGAIEGLMKGEKNVMAGIINDKLVYTSFEDSITKNKPLNQELIHMVKVLSV
ncbi:6-phosphofructokinase [Marivirga harenae]|uniref:6-phosphofructokinase n=1 Tax=Marivirga harenae TaxID=2010992 RepID=UPI0026E025F6|nr:6-phosphofructokinase [Marivirga harenae]WKV11791.1 6-phosphofructokinase [Marivirga harenae]|tara:strand:+ start:28142 stop:29113 length:972 start_codon:yes stop_codon:yes gene_type:complete